MQVKCSKCSRPIALTDVVESNDGRLSHIDCQRPNTLTPEERALIYLYCLDHVVAQCPICEVGFRFTDFDADIFGRSRLNLCPWCRQDLTEAVRAHFSRCAMLPAEVRRKAGEVREAAQRLVKESQQLRDNADVLIRETEAVLFARQRALRMAMSRRSLASPRSSD
jgi:hypothetical protein